MSTENLLTPRYKVIAEYPGGIYKVGDFVQPHAYYGFDIFPYPEKYPHLFKKLEWWEYRMPEEMPEYVKSIRQEYDYGIKAGVIVRVKKNQWIHFGGKFKVCYFIKSPTREYHPNCLIPATKTEYNEYLKQSK